jgi:hypothetical protein
MVIIYGYEKQTLRNVMLDSGYHCVVLSIRPVRKYSLPVIKQYKQVSVDLYIGIIHNDGCDEYTSLVLLHVWID